MRSLNLKRWRTPAPTTNGNQSTHASTIPSTNGDAVQSQPSKGEPSQATTSDNSKNYLPRKARRIWRRLNLLFGTKFSPDAAVSEKTKDAVSTGNTNSFNTLDVRSQDQSQSENSKIFSTNSNTAGIPVGLTWLDIDRNSNIRIDTFTRSISLDSVEIHLDSPEDTILYSAGCAWLDVTAKESNFQHGKFSTVNDSPLQKCRKQTSCKVTFPRPFETKPQVIVWLNGFHMSNADNWRCKVYATEITAQSFVIHIDTWASTILYSATASWIAHDSNLPNISSGSFNTMDIRPWYIPKRKNKGTATFQKSFESIPRIFAAVNWLDISNKTNLRLKLDISDVSAKGLTWNLDTWDCTVLYSAGASYIAILEV